MKLQKLTASIVCISMLAGCAKSTKEIPAQYVSPMQYEGFSCKQLQREMQAVSQRVSDIGGQVDKTASDDNAQMAVGLFLFWPALFFLDSSTPQGAEYARLKGEFDALEKASIQKGCGFRIERPQAPVEEEPLTEQYPNMKK